MSDSQQKRSELHCNFQRRQFWDAGMPGLWTPESETHQSPRNASWVVKYQVSVYNAPSLSTGAHNSPTFCSYFMNCVTNFEYKEYSFLPAAVITGKRLLFDNYGICSLVKIVLKTQLKITVLPCFTQPDTLNSMTVKYMASPFFFTFI